MFRVDKPVYLVVVNDMLPSTLIPNSSGNRTLVKMTFRTVHKEAQSTLHTQLKQLSSCNVHLFKMWTSSVNNTRLMEDTRWTTSSTHQCGQHDT